MTTKKQVPSFAQQVQDHPIYKRIRRPKFPLGDLVVYPGVASSVYDQPGNVAGLVARHARGDFGNRWAIGDVQYAQNLTAVANELDIVSRFTTPTGSHTLVVHTEADRSRTTVHVEPCRSQVDFKGENAPSATRDGLPERLTLTHCDGDAWHCLCGNGDGEPGFADADENAEDDPDRYVTTETIICWQCGRVFDRETRFVESRRPVTAFTEVTAPDVVVNLEAR